MVANRNGKRTLENIRELLEKLREMNERRRRETYHMRMTTERKQRMLEIEEYRDDDD